jgi:hypothetical protein
MAESHWIHENLVKDALKEAADQQLSDYAKLSDMLQRLQWGLDDFADWADTEEKRRNCWKHDKDPIRTISQEKAQFIDGLERLAWDYVSVPYRNEKIDRIFVDLLIAQEMYAFGGRWRALNGLPWAFGWRPQALRAMITVYSELNSSGVVSARRIHHIASEASGRYNIGWPAPLYVVLDDSISRHARLAPFP